MPLHPDEFEEGVRQYWLEIERRSATIQARERAFPELAARFGSRKPPHFTRVDLVTIMEWKHTDARWCDRAVRGIDGVSDDVLTALTSKIGQLDLSKLVREFDGRISGVGVASFSAIATAARPDLFSVIDDFALRAIHHYYDPIWIRSVYRDKKSQKFQPVFRDYAPFVEFCRATAVILTAAAKKPWSPRRVDMALWGCGKKLGTN